MLQVLFREFRSWYVIDVCKVIEYIKKKIVSFN